MIVFSLISISRNLARTNQGQTTQSQDNLNLYFNPRAKRIMLASSAFLLFSSFLFYLKSASKANSEKCCLEIKKAPECNPQDLFFNVNDCIGKYSSYHFDLCRLVIFCVCFSGAAKLFLSCFNSAESHLTLSVNAANRGNEP